MANIFNAPFPQANDFEKIKKIINIPDSKKLRDYAYMRVYLNYISDRQVDYYISACVYLALVDKSKVFTELGEALRNLKGVSQEAELSRIVVSDEVFGLIYFLQKFKGKQLDSDEIIEIMHSKMVFKSEAMYVRRASTIVSWLRWIDIREKNSGVVWMKEDLPQEENFVGEESIWDDMMIGDFVEEE